jgi:CRP-like cAMP-binding protein
MFQVFEAYLTAQASFTEAELEVIRSLSTARTYKKKQFLLTEGDVCRYKMFVCKGLLRSYRLTDDGVDHILRFTAENEWLTEPESFFNQTPSKYNIEALEDTDVLLWRHEHLEGMQEAVPVLKTLTDRLYVRSLTHIQQHIFKQTSFTPEQKYQDFLLSYPHIFGRVSLDMVASFLGVSRKTLTRIRRAQVGTRSPKMSM